MPGKVRVWPRRKGGNNAGGRGFTVLRVRPAFSALESKPKLSTPLRSFFFSMVFR
jgi:hypothetical protein